MIGSTSAYWQRYFTELAASAESCLDLSNPRVHAQSLALCIEAAGDVSRRACVDFGCGRGQLAAMLSDMGASPVIGVDLVPAMVERDRQSLPSLEWCQGDVADPALVDALPDFDRVFMVELLQYVDLAAVLRQIWQHVRPGGRLIGMVPNARCPIIAKTIARFDSHYRPARWEAIAALAAELDGLATWGCRGLHFADDQRILPYRVAPWTTTADDGEPPNRLNFVFLKRD